jgi:chemotaxis protein CheD
MYYKVPGNLEKHNVQPGAHYATDRPAVISTLLGSCVAACLFDPVSGVAGLNHFLLAAPRFSKDMPLTHTDAGRYGINAMELLINDMVHLGAVRHRLKAKVFGGATVLTGKRDNFFCIHEVNQRFIKEYLATEGIPLVSEDLGGTRGRVVYFHTDSFKVMRRFIQQTLLTRVEEEEHSYWQQHTEKPEMDEGAITLF